jgi:cystathionine beta-lyase/cystathionine gamma-synthase
LESHPRHSRAQQWFAGAGGLLSFELLGGVVAADRFLRSAQIPANAPSLGGAETLMTRPMLTSHAGLSAGDREKQGIADDLVRISVGLEAKEDLVDDFGQALDAIK